MSSRSVSRERAARIESGSLTFRLLPVLDIGLATLAAAVWYVRPTEGAWPLILIGVAWLVRTLAYGIPTRSTRFDVPLILFLTSGYVAATLGYNQDQRWLDGPTPLMWAWGKYWTLAAAVALFFAVANVRSPTAVRGVAVGLVVLAVVVTVYFVLTNNWHASSGKADVITQVGAWLAEPAPEVGGRRLHPNVVGGIIALSIPFGIALWLDAKGRRALRALWACLIAIASAGLVLSASRGAWLALAVALLGWALVRQMTSLSRNRSVIRLVLMAITVICVVVVVIASVDLGTFGNLAATPVSGVPGFGSGSVVGRVSLWQGGVGLAQDYVFTGAGLGTMPMLLSAYDLIVPVIFVPHAHNVFLNILVEQGAVGLLAFGWLLVAAFAIVWRWSRNAERAGVTGTERNLLYAACASLGVILLHGMVDDVAYGSRAMLLLFIPFGMIAALTAARRRAHETHHVPWRFVALSVAMVVAIAFWQRESLIAMAWADLGSVSQERTELTGYATPDRLPETVRREAALDTAIAYFTRALAHDAGNRTANQRLGMIMLAKGQYDAAERYLDAAYRSDPQDETLRILLADAYLAVGRSEEAYAFWSRIPDAPARLELTASLRYDKLNDRDRADAARSLAARLANERAAGR